MVALGKYTNTRHWPVITGLSEFIKKIKKVFDMGRPEAYKENRYTGI